MLTFSLSLNMLIRFLLRNIILLVAFLSAVSGIGEDAGPLRLEKEIPLPDVKGRIDHFSADVAGQRLFIAALENGSVEVVDTRQDERIAEIKGLPEPQGVYYESKTNQLYVATGGDGKLRVYNGKSLALREALEFGGDADNVRYDQQTDEVWVGYGNGGIGIVNSAGQKVGSVELRTHPESFQFDRSKDRVYANVPNQFGVAVIDRKSRIAVAKWGLGFAAANYPMALDETGKRLFVGCRLPARLIVLDTNSGQVVATLPTVGDTDDVFYDATRYLIYVIGGEGAVEVFRQRDPEHYESMGRTPTGSGARTGFFVPSFNRLYVAAPHRGSQKARVLVYAVD
jgi:DNA-binding beta-propeller fold protein YncE